MKQIPVLKFLNGGGGIGAVRARLFSYRSQKYLQVFQTGITYYTSVAGARAPETGIFVCGAGRSKKVLHGKGEEAIQASS